VVSAREGEEGLFDGQLDIGEGTIGRQHHLSDKADLDAKLHVLEQQAQYLDAHSLRQGIDAPFKVHDDNAPRELDNE